MHCHPAIAAACRMEGVDIAQPQEPDDVPEVPKPRIEWPTQDALVEAQQQSVLELERAKHKARWAPRLMPRQEKCPHCRCRCRRRRPPL